MLTSVHEPKATFLEFAGAGVETSWLQEALR